MLAAQKARALKRKADEMSPSPGPGQSMLGLLTGQAASQQHQQRLHELHQQQQKQRLQQQQQALADLKQKNAAQNQQTIMQLSAQGLDHQTIQSIMGNNYNTQQQAVLTLQQTHQQQNQQAAIAAAKAMQQAQQQAAAAAASMGASGSGALPQASSLQAHLSTGISSQGQPGSFAVRHTGLPMVQATAMQGASPAVVAVTQQQQQQQAGLQAVASGPPVVLQTGAQPAAEQQPRDEMLEREKAELESMDIQPPDNGQFVLDLDVLRARVTQVGGTGGLAGGWSGDSGSLPLSC